MSEQHTGGHTPPHRGEPGLRSHAGCDIPIVVVTWNRARSLQRLLASLDRSSCPQGVELIISIDGQGSEDVAQAAEQFTWRHGTKTVLRRAQRLGLREHILQCGALALGHDGIVLLEDDLHVAPHFYQFMLQTHDFYRGEARVAGIALYSPHFEETAGLPFVPLHDGYDVFFSSLACSWGQFWSRQHWEAFASWYAENGQNDLSQDPALTPVIRGWPATSWKKYFIKYMLDTDKYFVYPRISHVTNFGDSGEHHQGTRVFQTPLSLAGGALRLPRFHDSLAKYDCYGELLPEVLRRLCPELAAHDLCVDIYGARDAASCHGEYLLTTKPCDSVVKSWGLELKPHELNVIADIPGEAIRLAPRGAVRFPEDFKRHRLLRMSDFEGALEYYYALTRQHMRNRARQSPLARIWSRLRGRG
jgi:hypothetical protein